MKGELNIRKFGEKYIFEKSFIRISNYFDIIIFIFSGGERRIIKAKYSYSYFVVSRF